MRFAFIKMKIKCSYSFIVNQFFYAKTEFLYFRLTYVLLSHKVVYCNIAMHFSFSYGGMLAAYMRQKYPNIIIGAIAASAPIYQVAGKLSGNIFFKGVTKVGFLY